MTSEDHGTAEESSEIRDAIQIYWRYRRRTARTLITIVVASIAIIVFEPGRWAADEMGTVMLYGAWGMVILLILLAFRWNGEMAERHGYCVGKYGRTPQELESRTAVAD